MASWVNQEHISLSRILLATDFSSASEVATAYGVGLCRRYKCILYTVTVVPQEITDYVQPPDPFFLRHSAEKTMAEFAASDLLVGIDHHEIIKDGFVVDVIREEIYKHDVDLVVIGTHGYEGIKKLVMGSLAEEIANSVSCPVLTVGPKVALYPAEQIGLKRILVAKSLNQDSIRPLSCALRFAQQEQAKILLVHALVTPPNATEEQIQEQKNTAQAKLAQWLSTEGSQNVESEVIVETGGAANVLEKVARERGADLIVLGAHVGGYPQISTHLPVHISHHLISHAACPVLTVRD
jgi:nucleotide-binding universal stress UspA family protein